MKLEMVARYDFKMEFVYTGPHRIVLMRIEVEVQLIV